VPDPFGDLRDWGRVISKIGQLRQDGTLQENQDGLIRVLRYRFNWQLRQAALESVQSIPKPSPPLLNVLISIAGDESVELEFRLLACAAVNHVLWRSGSAAGGGDLRHRAALEADTLLAVTQTPVLRAAIQRWLGWDSPPRGVESSAGSRDEVRDSPLNPRDTSSFRGPAEDEGLAQTADAQVTGAGSASMSQRIASEPLAQPVRA